MTTDQPTQPLDVVAIRAHAEAATKGPWMAASNTGRKDVPNLLAEVERLRADVALADAEVKELREDLTDLAQARAVIDATRQMAIDANARLRAQLLAALDREDDGRTSLSTYVSHLVAQRDALKWSVGKAADEEERLRRDMAFAREEAKSIYDTCKQIERERDTMREVAQGNKRHVATLTSILERVEALAADRPTGAMVTVGEIRAAIAAPVAGEAGAR